MPPPDPRLLPDEPDSRLQDEEAPPAPAQDPGTAGDTAEDFAVGAGQGASLGWADEAQGFGSWLAGKIQAMGEGPRTRTAKPGVGAPVSDATDYTVGRDAARAREDLAHERSPSATGTGELVGGMAPALAMGPAGGTAAGLAATGAAAGLGGSRSDTAGGMARDAAVGAGAGLVTGKALHQTASSLAGAGPRLLRGAARTRMASTGMTEPEVNAAGGAGPASRRLRAEGVFKGVPNKAIIQERVQAKLPGAEQGLNAYTDELSGRLNKNRAQQAQMNADATRLEQAPLEHTPPSAPAAPRLDPSKHAMPPRPKGLVGPAGRSFAPREELPARLPPQGPAPDLNSDLPTLRPPPGEKPVIGLPKTEMKPIPRLRAPGSTQGVQALGQPDVAGARYGGEQVTRQGMPSMAYPSPMPPPALGPALVPGRGPGALPGAIGRTLQPGLEPTTAPITGHETTLHGVPIGPQEAALGPEPPRRPWQKTEQSADPEALAGAIRAKAAAIPTSATQDELTTQAGLRNRRDLLSSTNQATERGMQREAGSLGPSWYRPVNVINALSGGRWLTGKALAQEAAGHALSPLGRVPATAARTVNQAAAQEAALRVRAAPDQAKQHYLETMNTPAYAQEHVED